MDHRRSYRATAPVALVVVHTRLQHPLWDRAATGMTDTLEDLLDGVFVTSAETSSRPPRVEDALGAARFFGARSAVIVVPDERAARRVVGLSAAIPFQVAVSPDWSADGIATVFDRELVDGRRRECA